MTPCTRAPLSPSEPPPGRLPCFFCLLLGILFEQDADNRVRVADVQAGSQADATGLIFAGDRLLECSAVFGDTLWSVSNFKRTMSAIQQRQGDLTLVLERAGPRRAGSPPDTWAERAAPGVEAGVDTAAHGNGEVCESLSNGRMGVTWSVGKARMMLASFSLGGGCIVDVTPDTAKPAAVRGTAAKQPKAMSATRSATVEALLLTTPPTTPGAVAAADELQAALHACECLHPRLYVLNVPVTPRGLALLCVDYNIGGIVALQQPFEAGRDAAVAQAAASAAGARRITVPVADASRHDLCGALPVAAAAVARVADWVGPARGVLVTACDPSGLVAPTVAGACMHWHWGIDLEDVEEVAPTSDVEIINTAGAHLLAACMSNTALAEDANTPGSTDARADLMAFPMAMPDAPPPLHLFDVRFTWKGGKQHTSVMLVGEPAGSWDHTEALPMQLVGPDDGKASSKDGGEEWTTKLVLPRGTYTFKFIVDGKWSICGTHASVADTRISGNVNHVIHVGAPGSGHTPVRGEAALQWNTSPQRLALLRGCARRVALGLDDATLLPPGLAVANGTDKNLVELQAQGRKAMVVPPPPQQASGPGGGMPQILR